VDAVRGGERWDINRSLNSDTHFERGYFSEFGCEVRPEVFDEEVLFQIREFDACYIGQR